MFKDHFPSLFRSLEKLKQNQQLWFTFLIAVLITISFGFVVSRFVDIAQDAQNRLSNVRLGALQSSFVQFVPDYINNPARLPELQNRIQKIVNEDGTILEFKVIKFEKNKNLIIASIDKTEIGQSDENEHNVFMYGVAKIDPSSSYTIEARLENQRTFNTVRIIKDSNDNLIGAVFSKQLLSEADLIINERIKNSIVIFIFILILILYLFFRHSRIIDYSTLYLRLKEVDQLKDDFISMASHELRTPLSIIKGYAEELKESKENIEQNAERIFISAQQLDDLVNDMLDVSRIEQGRIKIESQIVNPNTLIVDVVDAFKKVAEDKNLKLIFKHNIQQNVKVKLDPDKFRQVLTNLIGNSIKYTNQGQVKVKTSLEGGKFIIRISDSGVGMTADEQKQLFQKFYRIRNEQTREVRGTGLGLWITKQLVELMNGRISVESISGVGTHFVLEFSLIK